MNDHSQNTPAESDKRFLVGMAGLSLLIVILLINAAALARDYEFEYEGWEGSLLMMVVVAVTCVWLPVGVALNVGPLRSRFVRLFFGRVMLVAGAAVTLFWIVVPLIVLSGNLYYDHATPEELVGAGLAIFAGTAVAGFILISLLSMVRSE